MAMARGARGARDHLRERRTAGTIRGILVGAVVIGSCILWQLFWMKQAFVERERYRIGERPPPHSNDNARDIPRHDENQGYYGTVGVQPPTKSKWSMESRGEDDFETMGQKQQVATEHGDDSNDRNDGDDSNDENAFSSVQQPSTLLDTDLIRNTLLREAPWAESHGANHLSFLGAGMLYYAMAYSFRSKTIVVLGSGGGFVPRMLKQAQRDLRASGVMPDQNGVYELYLVDAHLASAGWGSTFYAENKNTTMRRQFSDIRYVFRLTDDAYEEVFRPMHEEGTFSIDYLHVDADHGFEQSWKDFDQYSRLLSDRAVISFHDTCYDTARNCHDKGVPETIEQLKRESQKRGLQVVDLHYLYRGIAFAIRDQAPALQSPKDRRINFCVNNADLLDRTSEGFTKNGRVGSLPTLGDFMNCTQYSQTDLEAARGIDPKDPVRGIMAVPCSKSGFRRNPISGKCDRCILGLIGNECSRSKYVAQGEDEDQVDPGPGSGKVGDGEKDVTILARAWLETTSTTTTTTTPTTMVEVGPNAWIVLNSKKRREDFVSGPLLLVSGGDGSQGLRPDTTLKFTEMVVVDPFLVAKDPLWIDPTVSSRHRILPCTLKDALDFDDEQFQKDPSSISALGLRRADTLVCLNCDDLAGRKSGEDAVFFLGQTFPNLRVVVLGLNDGMESVGAFLDGMVAAGKGRDSEWRLDRDATVSLGDGSKKRLVLLTKPM